MRFYYVTLLAAVTSSAAAQTTSTIPERQLDRAEEIRLARSAAPAAVSDGARVFVLEHGRFVVAEEGTTDVTCMVARSRPGSLEPICYDREASRTILPIEIRHSELRLAGTPYGEVDQLIAEAIAAGELPLPSRPALAYMMSSGQQLVSDEGQSVGAWMPHLMLYVPYLTADELGLFGPPSTDAAMVFREGEPLANLVVVVREFVDP